MNICVVAFFLIFTAQVLGQAIDKVEKVVAVASWNENVTSRNALLNNNITSILSPTTVSTGNSSSYLVTDYSCMISLGLADTGTGSDALASTFQYLGLAYYIFIALYKR